MELNPNLETRHATAGVTVGLIASMMADRLSGPAISADLSQIKKA
jgi:hypothetical protein